MTIEKITGLQGKNIISKKMLNKQNSTKSQTIPKSNSTISESKMPKNNFLNGISFKGYTSEYTQHTKFYNGTSGNLVYIGPSDIDVSSDKKVRSGRRGYLYQSKEYAKVNVYYADPNETVTPEIENKHTFIVEYVEPPIKNITKKQIQETNTTSELVEILESLKMTKKQLETRMTASDERLKKAKSQMEEAAINYQKAKEEVNASQEENNSTSAELQSTNENIRLTQDKINKIKEEERIKFMIMEKISKLQEIKAQLESLGDDETISAISAQIESYLQKLELDNI